MKILALLLLALSTYSLNAFSIKNKLPETLYVTIGSHPECTKIEWFEEKYFPSFDGDDRVTIRIVTKKIYNNNVLILGPTTENDFSYEVIDGFYHIGWTVLPDAHLTVDWMCGECYQLAGEVLNGIN